MPKLVFETDGRAPPVLISPSLDSAEAFLLLAVLPIVDYNRILYIYSCLPLHFLEQGWPLWQLSALLCVSAVVRNPVAWLIVRRGDELCVPLLFLAALSSAWMALAPDSKSAVLVAITLGQAIKCQQPYRGLCHRLYGAWPDVHEAALRKMTVADVAGYSSAAFWGGVLYESGGFAACALFQFCMTAVQATLTLGLLWRWRRQNSAVHTAGGDGGGCGGSSRNNSSSSSSSAETRKEEQCANEDPAKALPTQTSPPSASFPPPPPPPPPLPSAAPSLREAGLERAAALTVAAGSLSIFLYGCEWNTFALYFRQVWGWGSAWTGFAQMAGDALAGGGLLAAGYFGVPLPLLLDKPRGLVLAFALYAACFVMLAQPVFAVAVTGQVAMGSAFVLISELVSQMLRTHGQGDAELYRQLLLGHELAFNFAVAASSVAILVYDWHREAPFWGCAGLAASFAAIFTVFYARRYRNHGGLWTTAKTFDEIEAALVGAAHAQSLDTELKAIALLK